MLDASSMFFLEDLLPDEVFRSQMVTDHCLEKPIDFLPKQVVLREKVLKREPYLIANSFP